MIRGITQSQSLNKEVLVRVKKNGSLLETILKIRKLDVMKGKGIVMIFLDGIVDGEKKDKRLKMFDGVKKGLQKLGHVTYGTRRSEERHMMMKLIC